MVEVMVAVDTDGEVGDMEEEAVAEVVMDGDGPLRRRLSTTENHISLKVAHQSK